MVNLTKGKKGTAAGEFDVPHAIATDSRRRVFVGDRSNLSFVEGRTTNFHTVLTPQHIFIATAVLRLPQLPTLI